MSYWFTFLSFSLPSHDLLELYSSLIGYVLNIVLFKKPIFGKYILITIYLQQNILRMYTLFRIANKVPNCKFIFILYVPFNSWQIIISLKYYCLNKNIAALHFTIRMAVCFALFSIYFLFITPCMMFTTSKNQENRNTTKVNRSYNIQMFWYRTRYNFW